MRVPVCSCWQVLSSFWAFCTKISVTGLLGVPPRFLGGASSFLSFLASFCCFLLILAAPHFSASFWQRASACLASQAMSSEMLSITLGTTSLWDLPEVGFYSNPQTMFTKTSLTDQLSMAKVMPSQQRTDPCTSVVYSLWFPSTFTTQSSQCVSTGISKKGVVVGSSCPFFWLPTAFFASDSSSASARCQYSSTMSRTDERLDGASHVASAYQKSFHFTRYSALPLMNRLASIFSTSKYCSTTFWHCLPFPIWQIIIPKQTVCLIACIHYFAHIYLWITWLRRPPSPTLQIRASGRRHRSAVRLLTECSGSPLRSSRWHCRHTEYAPCPSFERTYSVLCAASRKLPWSVKGSS